MSRSFKRERGFLTFAQNGEADYLRMAYALALSLKATQSEVSNLSVVITPGMTVPNKYRQVFDEVIDIPWLDEARQSTWKLENEWKAYHATPYKETIKLDADMLFPADIGPWWDQMAQQDVYACTHVVNYRGDPVTSDFYRKTFTESKLPNIYTALMYFKYSDLAEEVFKMAEVIFHNWQRFFYDYLEDDHRPEAVSTDVVFALAMKLVGADECTHPNPLGPRFVHMKSRLQDWPEHGTSENWTQHVNTTLTDDLDLKIGFYRQSLPFHYFVKSFLTDEIIETYEKKLGL